VRTTLRAVVGRCPVLARTVRILVDTTAFVALLDRRHSRHWVLRDMLSLLFKADATLVVTNCIVLETFDVLRRRFAARSLRLLASSFCRLVRSSGCT